MRHERVGRAEARPSERGSLFLRLRGRFAGFLGKRFHPLEFRLETTREIVGPVFEKHDKTKGEKDEKDEPEKPAKHRHKPMVTYSLSQVNGLAGQRQSSDLNRRVKLPSCPSHAGASARS
jgi:hypothetical protein